MNQMAIRKVPTDYNLLWCNVVFEIEPESWWWLESLDNLTVEVDFTSVKVWRKISDVEDISFLQDNLLCKVLEIEDNNVLIIVTKALARKRYVGLFKRKF